MLIKKYEYKTDHSLKPNHTGMMIEQLLARKNQSGVLNTACQKITLTIWLLFQRKSQRSRIKKALKIISLIRQKEFKEHPERLFAYIRKIDPFVFEELLLLSFKARGIKIQHNKRYTGDGGIDGIIFLENKRYAIQAKRYTQHINASHSNHFKQAISSNRCSGGFFIHTGKSGQGVYQNLDSSIYLISGANLHRLLTDSNG